MTVAELLDRIDSNELAEWMARDRVVARVDPNRNAAMIAFTVARSFGGGKAKFEDFLPKPAKVGPPRVQTPAEQMAVFDLLAKHVPRK